MSDNTKISWSDATWNFVTGCTKVSDGCTHCYIERTVPFRVQHRKFDKPGIGGTTGVKLHSDRLGLPLHWRKPRLVFVNSLADLFHEAVPDQFIAEGFAVMALAPRHTFQLLTKRPARMRALLTSPAFYQAVEQAIHAFARDEATPLDKTARRQITHSEVPVLPWPLPNVWVGVSVEDQKWAEIRIPVLLDTPAAVRWISAEPLLGPVDLSRWLDTPLVCGCADNNGAGCSAECMQHEPPGLGWVVTGGESGPNARPAHPNWFRLIRDQCVCAGVAYHHKQWGAWTPDKTGQHLVTARRSRYPVAFIGPNGEEYDPQNPPMMDPSWATVYKKGVHATGRVLDGKVWDQYPVPADREVTHA